MTNGEGQGEGSLLALALLALAAGALAGLVGAIFRLCLAQADRLRDVLIARAHSWGLSGFCSFSPHALPRLRLPPGWFVATRRMPREAASLTSKRSCVASFRRRLFV